MTYPGLGTYPGSTTFPGGPEPEPEPEAAPVAATAVDIADGRIVQIPGLPDFNGTDAGFRITGWEGIFDTAVPDAQYTAAGGSGGAVASGPWLPKEKPTVLQGFIDTGGDLAALPGYARALANALPASRDAAVRILGNGRDIDLQCFVRRYDKAQLPITSRLDFTIPLLHLDPYMYGVAGLEGSVAVDAGAFWFGSYSAPGASWSKRYVKSGSDWFRTYSNVQPPGPFPTTLALTAPPGGITSRRLIITVVGPLTAGDWQLSQVGTGREMWVQLSIPAGQQLSIDCYAEAALFNGEDVSSYLYGDMLTLEPGGSTYKLTSSTPNTTAYATVSALPAYEI